MSGQTAAILIIAAMLIVVVFVISRTAFKFIFKMLLNTVIGFFALFLIDYLGGFIGIAVGINWINALIVGILGVPGVALILMFKWLTAF